jgi:hypothetical protein
VFKERDAVFPTADLKPALDHESAKRCQRRGCQPSLPQPPSLQEVRRRRRGSESNRPGSGNH